MLKNSILVVLTAATLTFAGCSKEKKYTKKIEGSWNVTKAMINDTDVFSSISTIIDEDASLSIEMDYDEDGDFDIILSSTYIDDGQTYSYSYTFLGTWEITDTDLNMEYTNSEIGGIGSVLLYFIGIEEYDYINDESYEIVELKKDKLILEGTNQGYTVRIEAEAD